MPTAQLIPFPNAPSNENDDFTLSVSVNKTGPRIQAQFDLQGNTAAIQWPAAATPGQGKDLWKHTCFELFLTTPDTDAYWEYNFSPSRQWAVYAFQYYRQPTNLDLIYIPVIEPPQRSPHAFTLLAQFQIEPSQADQVILLGASAVIETVDNQKRYYALRHCGEKPDFHLRDSFVLQLE